jgi:hypothetical protein
MATVYGRAEFGYFSNGNFETGTNQNFTFGNINSSSAYSKNFCLERTGGGGGTYISPQRIEVDVSQSYQMIMYARTLQRGGTSGTDLAGGHLGFACYDKNDVFIDLRSCGGVGNTYLTRDLVAGDSYAYIASTGSWNRSETSAFRNLLVYPPTHPDYSAPHQLTRIGFGDYNIFYSASIQQMPEGDYRLHLVNSVNVPTVFPSIGYATPSGSAVSNGQSGGTYSYALGAPNYPETWTRYDTPVFTGANRNSAYPFRFGTKYIRFMCLLNYNRRLDAVQNHVWAIDNVFFGKVLGGKDYRNSL